MRPCIRTGAFLHYKGRLFRASNTEQKGVIMSIWFVLVPALLILTGGLWYLRKRRQIMAKYKRRTTQVATPVPVPVAAGGDALKDLDGKVAIVTGGGTGLGRAMALALSRRGAKVVVASRKIENLQPVVDEITAAGGQGMAFAFDVRNYEQVQELVAKTKERFGRIDILINNAAGNFYIPAENLTPNGWNAVIGIVLNGTWYCTHAAGQEMIKQGSGQILNIVANYAWSGQPGVVHSCAAKAGVLAMTRTLAVEWGGYGVRVNAFAPGAMVTENASANLKFDTDDAQQKIRKYVPVGRLTSPEEMAEMALFLLSPAAAYINGEVLTADGGAWLPRGWMDLVTDDGKPK